MKVTAEQVPLAERRSPLGLDRRLRLLAELSTSMLCRLDIRPRRDQIGSMLDLFKQLLVNQFEAALCTLKVCVDRCPDAMWNAPVGNLAFCQVAFHDLFYADLYLGQNEEDVRRQPFHLAHEQVFRDYEELEDRRQQLYYDRPFIQSYVGHCRDKARAVVAAETEDSLAAPSGFQWLKLTRGELHVYNIRHIQHHAAQLSLRLRLGAQEQISWIGTGWRS